MGMDIHGRNPTNEKGKYFRANIWSWRPIHALITQLCPDILSEETLTAIGYNDGSGPETQETCTQIANRFQQWMEHNTHGHNIQIPGIQVTPEGRFVTEQELNENPNLKTTTPYKTNDEHLKAWIEFLQHCGGFMVY